MNIDDMSIEQINDLVDEIFARTKKCTDCKKRKNPGDFYNNRNNKDGKDSLCKGCRKARNLAFRTKNPDYAKDHWHNVRKPGTEAGTHK